MISIYQLKPAFQNLLRPICQQLARQGVTPNQVTLSALILSVISGAVLALFSQYQWPLLLLAPVLFLRMALNAIDGMLAREHHMTSRLGTILNEMGDILSDVALYLPLALFSAWPAEWVTILVVLSLVSEIAGIIAVQIGVSRRYDGPMGKSDRAFLFGGLGLLIGLGMNLEGILPFILIAAALLLLVTTWRRLSAALKEAEMNV